MSARKHSEVPASLTRLGQRLAAWRRTRVSGQRIPEALWKSAVRMAGEHGLNRTARFLNLDYYTLKKRVDSVSVSKSTFVELSSSPLGLTSECMMIEWEDAAGCRMRVELKGPNAPDLLALSRSFWNVD